MKTNYGNRNLNSPNLLTTVYFFKIFSVMYFILVWMFLNLYLLWYIMLLCLTKLLGSHYL